MKNPCQSLAVVALLSVASLLHAAGLPAQGSAYAQGSQYQYGQQGARLSSYPGYGGSSQQDARNRVGGQYDTLEALKRAKGMDVDRNRMPGVDSLGRRPPLEPDTTPSPLQKIALGLGYQIPVFGAEYFRDPPSTFAAVEQSAPPADYRLGTGDLLEVRTWGAISVVHEARVDGAGQIFIPQVGPVSVGGVPFGEVDALLKAAISRQYRNFEVQASLSRQNAVRVHVTGCARAPGAYVVGGFSTIMNALMASGGPSSNGSMRRIELRRRDSLVGTFDLYALLLGGDRSGDLSLRSGDVIHIPPVREQVAITEGVVRGGIYEILPGNTLKDLVEWAGGLAVGTDARRFRMERVVQDSGLSVRIAPFGDSGRSVSLASGQMFHFFGATPRFADAVSLRGHVRVPGRFPWQEGMRIHDLLPRTSDLVPDEFWNTINRRSSGADFTGLADARDLDVNLDYALVERLSADSLKLELIPFALGNALQSPGGTDDIVLQKGDVVTVFGAKDLAVPIRYRPVFVRLGGEISKAGLYKLRYGETLRGALEKAGGLTKDAYLFGSRFTRKSVLEAQVVHYADVVKQMRMDFESNAANLLAAANSVEESKLLQGQIDAQRKWLDQLEQQQPDGRLVLGLEPRRDLGPRDLPDMLLEDGDVLDVPSKPGTVEVYGEVSRQSTLLCTKGRDIGDFLELAGGKTAHADGSQVYVVRADGSVVSERDYGFLFWQLASMGGMPGDVVVVPRKVETSRWVSGLKDWTQILSGAGMSIVAILILSRSM